MVRAAFQRLGAAFAAFRSAWSGCCPVYDCIGSDRLANLMSAAPVVLYATRWAPDFALTFISGNVRQFCGIEAAHLLEGPERWGDTIHPDDRALRRRALETLADRGRMTLDYRVRHAEGGWRWVRDEARVQLDPRGQPVEVVGSWQDISERRAWELALSDSEAQLRTAQSLLTDALDSSGDAFSLFDADDRLVAFNQRFREFYHTIADEIRPGATFEHLVRVSAQRGQYAGIGPEDVDNWVAQRMGIHHQATAAFEQKLADGRCLEIIERPTADGGRVAIRRDVTDRKRVEEALRRELTFEQALIDALPFPVFVKHRDGRFLGCNAKFAEAIGLPIAAIIGRTLFDILPRDRAEEYTSRDDELYQTRTSQTREVTMSWSDGSIRRLHVVKGVYLDADGKVGGHIGSLIDITEQKRAEEQLVQAAKLATLGQIASEVAHELNQPLSIIRMSAEICLQAGDRLEPERCERKMNAILSQVRRMAEMVDHLRSFSRLESGEHIPFAPAPVVATATRLLSPHFQLDDIALDVHIDHECPEILGRPNQFEQVILNLLGNARDAVREHCPPGAGHVELSLQRREDSLVLTVTDNGGGVPERMWPMVFDPFFTTKSDGTGTGLGLSISANIIAGMGGRIDGHNGDCGAVFTVTLPTYRAAGTATGTPAPPPAPPTPCAPEILPPDRPRARVLVVDDEELAVDCIVDYLTARGFAAMGATTPDQAQALAREQPADLVISDLRLPGLSGIGLLARLRAELGDVPAILMTGGPLPAEPVPGAVFLRKPLALAELARRAKEMLDERETPCSA